jgi:hypothetical protein
MTTPGRGGLAPDLHLFQLTVCGKRFSEGCHRPPRLLAPSSSYGNDDRTRIWLSRKSLTDRSCGCSKTRGCVWRKIHYAPQTTNAIMPKQIQNPQSQMGCQANWDSALAIFFSKSLLVFSSFPIRASFLPSSCSSDCRRVVFSMFDSRQSLAETRQQKENGE